MNLSPTFVLHNNKEKNMPTILILFGLKFRIYVRDHEPVHVHVISQDGEAKFKVDDEVELIENFGMKPKDIKLAESIIEENKELVKKEWIKIYGK
jgi:hypothetical protein